MTLNLDASPPPLDFEAMSSPMRGLTPDVLLYIGLLLGSAALICGIGFIWLGAWPVFGFLGVEVLLVLVLLASHARWSSRAFECVRLSDGRLTVERDDGQGRRETITLDAYWVRSQWIESPAGDGRLRLTVRDSSIEIGHFLNAPERRSLHNALESALFEWRNPTFNDNQPKVENSKKIPAKGVGRRAPSL